MELGPCRGFGLPSCSLAGRAIESFNAPTRCGRAAISGQIGSHLWLAKRGSTGHSSLFKLSGSCLRTKPITWGSPHLTPVLIGIAAAYLKWDNYYRQKIKNKMARIACDRLRSRPPGRRGQSDEQCRHR
jgi:hypothetical protein